AVRSNVRRGGRQKVSRINEVGEARLPVNLNNGHQVQTQECKVSEVVAGQRFALQMRVHTSKPAEAAGGGTGTAEVGHLDALCVADHDILNLALAVKQHADLPAGLMRKLTHLAREFLRNDVPLRDAARAELFDPF